MRRSSKLPKDANQLAYEVVKMSTEEVQGPAQAIISEYLSRIGRRGGLKGGKARARELTAEKRTEIARKAAKSRWSKQREES